MALVEHLWSRIDVRGEHECWPWIGSRDRAGYGYFKFFKRCCLAHREMFKTEYGPLPIECTVMQSCGNRDCCNPEHLKLGSKIENIQERKLHGRGPKYRKKISAEQLEEVRLDPRSVRKIASSLGVSKTTIWRYKCQT